MLERTGIVNSLFRQNRMRHSQCWVATRHGNHMTCMYMSNFTTLIYSLSATSCSLVVTQHWEWRILFWRNRNADHVWVI